MGAPTSLLQGSRAFARDFPRDQMPKGYLWDVIDYVPSIIDAELTGRGGWVWGSDQLGGDAETGILATFTTGDQLLVQTAAGQLVQVDPSAGTVVSNRGAIARAIQNPMQRHDEVIWTDGSGASVPVLARSSSFVGAAANAPKGKVSCLWGEYFVLGGVPGTEDAVYFSHPSNDLATTGGWDDKSVVRTATKVTALAALRSVIIVFHPGTTERIRGSIPPNSTTAEDDLNVEPLFSRVGCPEPKTIAYWNENIVFADEHGVHLTDGAVIRNLVSQGGISYFWRTLWGSRLTVAGATFLDYYQVTIRPVSGPSVTLICDLNKRQWFRFQNVYALSYIASGGGTGMERLWGGMGGNGRLARVSACYFPVLGTGSIADADGASVSPEFETPWYKLTQEGRKRVRFVYLSYDVRNTGAYADASPGVGTYERESAPPGALAAPGPEMLEVAYIRSPQDPNYTVAGTLPATSTYTRYRLPVGQFPYGIAFKVRQMTPASVNRIFDLAVEAQPAERSRV